MVDNNSKVAMISAVNEAIKIKKQHPYADAEDIMPRIMGTISSISKKDEARLSAISAVNSTINYMNQNPHASEKEIFQYILDKSSELIDSLQEAS